MKPMAILGDDGIVGAGLAPALGRVRIRRVQYAGTNPPPKKSPPQATLAIQTDSLWKTVGYGIQCQAVRPPFLPFKLIQ